MKAKERMVMKAEELMVGDWVRCTDPKPFRICIIDDFDKVAAGEDSFFVDLADLQPIPLTAEIIDKNFPKGKDSDNIKEWYFDDNITHMFRAWFHHIGNAPDIGMSIKVEGKGQMAVLLRYVHELQHALRLLGIEKEIEI